MVGTVSDSNLPPEQWRALFDAAGIEFGYRPLANRIGTTHTRVRRVLRGAGSSTAAMQAVADELGVPVSRVRELRGEDAIEMEPFTLPDDAGRLNDDERDVIRAMVRALLNARGTANAERDDLPIDPSSESDASSSPVESQEAGVPATVDITWLNTALGALDPSGDYADRAATIFGDLAPVLDTPAGQQQVTGEVVALLRELVDAHEASQPRLKLASKAVPRGYRKGQSEQGDAGGEESQEAPE